MTLALASSLSVAVLLLSVLTIEFKTIDGCPYMMDKNGGGGRSRSNDVEVEASILPHNHPSMEQSPSSFAAARRQLQQFSFFSFLQSLFSAFLNAILSFFGFGNAVPTTTAEAIANAKSDVADLIDDDDDLAAKFLRLAFHDCIGGTCDGCVDLSNADNTGLLEPIAELRSIVTEYSDFLSRADVWMLAGLTSVEVTQDNTNVAFDMEFVDRPVCDDETGGPTITMPSAHFHTTELTEFFDSEFSLTTRESVAIMGGHTLGRAVSQNSGFDGNGGWVRNRNRFDNAFYTTLLDGNEVDDGFELELNIAPNNTPFPDQFFWSRGNRFMLNADMALVFDLVGQIDSINGDVDCNVNTCPTSTDTIDIVREYANSNQVWLQDFHTAFMKITNMGCDTDSCTSL